jgi:hypothetical protein
MVKGQIASKHVNKTDQAHPEDTQKRKEEKCKTTDLEQRLHNDKPHLVLFRARTAIAGPLLHDAAETDSPAGSSTAARLAQPRGMDPGKDGLCGAQHWRHIPNDAHPSGAAGQEVHS